MWLFCRQTIAIKELGERPEGTGTLCPIGEGCSEQGIHAPAPALFKHKGCVPRGQETCGRGVPAIGVPCGPLGLIVGDGNGARLDPARELEGDWRFVRV